MGYWCNGQHFTNYDKMHENCTKANRENPNFESNADSWGCLPIVLIILFIIFLFA